MKDWDFKCFSNRGRKYIEADGRTAPEDAVIHKKDIRDLTENFKSGRLECELPEGNWTVLRIGYRALNQMNGTGTRLGKGLECDKLSKEALRIHWANYVEKTVKALGPELAGPNGSLKTVLNDSYESGTQNWTHGFEEMFAKHSGYGIMPYLPALCGKVVDSVEATEAFYRDFRLAVTDAFVDNYAGEMRRLAHKCGLQLAIEPYGEIPSDDLLYGEQADIPTAEFWAQINSPHWVRQAASIAHAKGRKIVAAESFTTNAGEGRWQNTPWSMKAKCDWVYSEGLNRIIYHRFAHQPWTNPVRLPGMTMGPFWVHFDRTQTWWKQAKPFLRYQQRCQFLLQEGEFVSDVAWYCPAGYLYINWGRNPHKMPVPVPAGFTYDFVSDTTLAEMRVKDGLLVLPSGQKYKTVILPEKGFALLPQSLAMVRRLREEGAEILSFETYLLDGEERVAYAPERGVLQLPEPDLDLIDLPGLQTAVTKVAGAWRLEFPVDWYVGGNAVKSIDLAELKDWTTLSDADMKYFSGTAIYKKTIEVERTAANERLILDFGDVKNFADITINGKQFETLWKPPFRLDITGIAASSPKLDLVIRVTNLWPNRIIGDDFKEEDCTFEPGKPIMERHLNGWPQFILEGKASPSGKWTFATWKHWTKEDTPLPSGLLGPVVLRVVR